jgi:RNA polymerase sigma factor (sigma-70 family)
LRHLDEFVSFVRKRYGIETEVAKDIYQDAIIDLCTGLQMEKLQFQEGKEKSLLFQIGVNQVKNHFRAERVRGNYLESQVIKNESDKLIYQNQEVLDFQVERVQSLMKDLSDEDRQILQLFYNKGYGMESIARELNYNSVNYAKKKKHGALKKLIQLVKSAKMILL